MDVKEAAVIALEGIRSTNELEDAVLKAVYVPIPTDQQLQSFRAAVTNFVKKHVHVPEGSKIGTKVVGNELALFFKEV